MRDKTELAVSIDHAKQAESILSHPLFIASMATLKNLTIEKFENLGFDDTKQMQECNMRLGLIEEFESHFSTIIQSGNAAFKALEDIQTHEQEMNR